jgi:hypothetical protein
VFTTRNLLNLKKVKRCVGTKCKIATALAKCRDEIIKAADYYTVGAKMPDELALTISKDYTNGQVGSS